MPKDTSITILLPAEEKAIIEDFCSKTGRNTTEVIRAFIRSLVQELPFHYGLVSVGGDPLEFWMSDGRKLSEEQFFTEFPQAYKYYKAGENCNPVQLNNGNSRFILKSL